MSYSPLYAAVLLPIYLIISVVFRWLLSGWAAASACATASVWAA